MAKEYQTKEDFLKWGCELTICETTPLEDPLCVICTTPIYVVKCDNDPATHHHQCSTEQNAKPETPATADPDEPAEPGLKILACGHVFGNKCLRAWLRDKHSCPTCRRQL
jgi:hypothetical protein